MGERFMGFYIYPANLRVKISPRLSDGFSPNALCWDRAGTDEVTRERGGETNQVSASSQASGGTQNYGYSSSGEEKSI